MNPKTIGNNAERYFSKRLSLWMTGDPNADVCWRDVGSGNRFTVRKKQGKDTARKADIVCVDSQYEDFFKLFYIDSKSHKEINLNLINPKNQKSNVLLNDWLKVRSDCPDNMIPMMLVQVRDRSTPDLIVLGFATLANYKSYFSCYINYLHEQIFSNKILGEEGFSICNLDDFFELNNYKKFYEVNKKYIA